jgi:prepilin-type N-terminal cleavage/methylation domain-containing protein
VKHRIHLTRRGASGFTLTELAVVVTILALVLGGVVLTLSATASLREVEQTQARIDQAREALLGFFVRNGRFPCPAIPAAPGAGAGVESPAGGGVCTNPYNGFLPAATLGIGPTDAQGYLVDAWGNRVRYAVSQYVHTPPFVDAATCAADARRCVLFTTTNALAQVGISNLAPMLPELRVCDVANCAGPLNFPTPVVVFSTGRNFASLGAPGPDEQENIADAPVPDFQFVAHEPRPSGAASGEFDDVVSWISPNILYNRLIAAGAI